MTDDPNAVSVNDAPRRVPRPATRREREQRAALTLWFAVQRMLRRKSEPPGPSAAEAYPPGSPDLGNQSGVHGRVLGAGWAGHPCRRTDRRRGARDSGASVDHHLRIGTGSTLDAPAEEGSQQLFG